MAKNDWGDDDIKEFTPEKTDCETILASLAEKKYQSLPHLARNTGISVEIIFAALSLLQLRGDVAETQAGSVTAYFLTENVPDGKLYLGGDHEILLRPNEPQEENEMEKGKHSRKRIDIDPAQIERLAADGLSQISIARKLKVSLTTLTRKLQQVPEIKTAYGRGVGMYKNHGKATTAVSQAEEPTDADQPEPEPEKVLEDRGFYFTLRHPNVNPETIKNALLAVRQMPEPEDVLELPNDARESVVKSAHTKEIKMSGGRLLLGFEGNIFEMDARERLILNDVIDVVQELESK